MKIEKANSQRPTYDLEYADGDFEEKVPEALIRPLPSLIKEQKAIYDKKIEQIEKTLSDLQQKVFYAT